MFHELTELFWIVCLTGLIWTPGFRSGTLTSAGILGASGNPTSRWQETQNPTQRRTFMCDCKMHTLAGKWIKQRWNLSHQKRSQGIWTIPNLKSGFSKKRKSRRSPVAHKTAWVKLPASGTPKAGRELGHIISKYLPATIHHTDAVFSIVREIHGRTADDRMEDLDVNTAIWWIFMNATRRPAVHLGQDYEANLRYVNNILWNTAKQLFSETGRLISGQTDITDTSTIDFQDLTWMSTSRLKSRPCQFSNDKACEFSDYSVEIWEMILLNSGRGRFNGTQKMIFSKRWVESTACRLRSSGQFSQDSQRWASSSSLENFWKIYWSLMNLNNSPQNHLNINVQRHCMEREWKQKGVNTIHWKLRIMD